MSTKRTIDHELHIKGMKPKPKTSVPFHLYTDMEDDNDACGTVHLDISGVSFVASPGGVDIAIPPDVWNRIVKAGPVKVRRIHGNRYSDKRPEFPKQTP
jgi:hypothetical protein